MSDRNDGAETHKGDDDDDDDGGQVGWRDRLVRMGGWNQRVDDGRMVKSGQDVRCACSRSKSISGVWRMQTYFESSEYTAG